MEKSANDMWLNIVTHGIYLSSPLSCLCGWFVVCYTMFLFHLKSCNICAHQWFVIQYWCYFAATMGMHEHMLDVPTKQGRTWFLCVVYQATRSLDPRVMNTSKSVPLMWAFSVVIILERGSSIVRACIWTLCFDCAPLMQRRRRLLYYLLWYYCKADPKGCVHVAWGCSQVRSCSMIPHYLTTTCCVLCYDVNLNTFKTSSLGNGLNFFLDKWC